MGNNERVIQYIARQTRIRSAGFKRILLVMCSNDGLRERTVFTVKDIQNRVDATSYHVMSALKNLELLGYVEQVYNGRNLVGARLRNDVRANIGLRIVK